MTILEILAAAVTGARSAPAMHCGGSAIRKFLLAKTDKNKDTEIS